MKNLYVIGKVENKREGQAAKVVQVVKKFGPISTLDICKKLSKEKKDCISWHVSQLHKAKCLTISKKEVK